MTRKIQIDEILDELNHLREQNEFLTKEHRRLLEANREITDENSFLKRQNTGMKFRLRDYSQKIMELEDKLQNVTLWDLSPEAQEEAGHALARSLLGGK